MYIIHLDPPLFSTFRRLCFRCCLATEARACHCMFVFDLGTVQAVGSFSIRNGCIEDPLAPGSRDSIDPWPYITIMFETDADFSGFLNITIITSPYQHRRHRTVDTAYRRCTIDRVSYSITWNSRLHGSITSAILPQVTTFNDLGILIDDKLTFSAHIRSSTIQAYSKSIILSRCFLSRNPKLYLPLLSHPTPASTGIRIFGSIRTDNLTRGHSLIHSKPKVTLNVSNFLFTLVLLLTLGTSYLIALSQLAHCPPSNTQNLT